MGLLLVLPLAASLAACGADSEDSALLMGGAGTAGNAPVPTALAFDGSSELRLAPGEVRALHVVASPPGTYLVRFGLLGDPGDASLDYSEVTTSPGGVAEVVLTAPSTERIFHVRASIGTSLTAQTSIAVGKGFTTLQVTASYDGERPVVSWVASARTGKTCADLAGNPPPDGDFVAQALAFGAPEIVGVPAEATLAVTLRAGRSIGGCTVVSDLAPNTVHEIVVPVSDVPVDFARTDLEFSMKIDAPSANVDAVLDETEAQMLERLSGGRSSDVTSLLDAMAEAVDPAEKPSFVAQRDSAGWETRLTLAFGLGASSELRRPLRAWFAAARQQLLEREMLSGVLLTSEENPDSVPLRLSRVFDYDPIAAGFSPALVSRLAVSVQPGDDLVVGGTLEWFPPQLLGRITSDVAIAKVTGAASGPDALAAELSCDTVADLLAEHGVDATHSFTGCDRDCTRELCATALQDLWDRMVDVADVTPAKLVLSATGAASINEFAHIATAGGSWNANLDFGGVTGKLTGELEANGVPVPVPTR
jgi:hypothetical protein